MINYTSKFTIDGLEKELSKDDIANLEDYLADAVFDFTRKFNIPFRCLSFID